MHRLLEAADEAGEITDRSPEAISSMRSSPRRATHRRVPPVPTATTTSPRSDDGGKVKLECERSSITFTGRPTAFARGRQSRRRYRRQPRENRNDAAEICRKRIAVFEFDLRDISRLEPVVRDCHRAQTTRTRGPGGYQQAQFFARTRFPAGRRAEQRTLFA